VNKKVYPELVEGLFDIPIGKNMVGSDAFLNKIQNRFAPNQNNKRGDICFFGIYFPGETRRS